jgi:hypothetical protein
MEIIKVVSQSMGSLRAEVIIQNDKGLILTKHIHRHSKGWYYNIGFQIIQIKKGKERRPVAKFMDTQPNI